MNPVGHHRGDNTRLEARCASNANCLKQWDVTCKVGQWTNQNTKGSSQSNTGRPRGVSLVCE